MKAITQRVFTVGIILTMLLGVLPFGEALAAPSQYVSPGATVFINEIHYDNASTDTGEAIEIAGPAGTDLTGWSVVLYNAATGAVYDTDALSGTIPGLGGEYGTVVLTYPSNGIQNGSPDGLALIDNSDSVVMFLSYEGTFTAAGGAANGLVSTDIGVIEGGSDPIGYSLQLTGSGTTYDDFTWAAAAPSTFGALNTGQSFGVVDNQPVTVTCGANITAYEGMAVTRQISASDADGIVTSLTAEGLVEGITLSDTTPASENGGTASATLTVADTVLAGNYSVTVTAANNDETPQTTSCTLTISVTPVLTIGEVQGAVSDTDNGATHRSQYAPPSGNNTGQTVFVRGVITEKIISVSSSGQVNQGFFIQSPPSFTDGDPQSSDGIFVFVGTFDTLRILGGGFYPFKVGDEVLLRGPVVEYFNLTQLSNPYLIQVIREGVDLESETPVFEVDPPASMDEANRYWERREGMLAQVPAGSIAVDGRDVFLNTFDAEIWLARGDSPIAQRDDPYARRVFRDPHPLDDDPALFDNGNGYRFVLGSMGLKTATSKETLLAPVSTFDTITNAPVGAVYYSFSKYQIMVQEQVEYTDGVDPALNNPPQIDSQREYSVANYNMENLYDFRDDPNDGCDFAGNAGCPGVRPPFDYVPPSQETYGTRLSDIAKQIVNDLHSPELLMVQEVEDQDICSLSGGAITCGSTSNADGQPDALQDLALEIVELGGPLYYSAYDSNGADDRGIVSAFLYRADQVELLPVDAAHPLFGADPQIDYRADALAYNSDVSNPKAFNAELPDDVDRSTGTDGSFVYTRPPQVGWFRVWRDGVGASVFTDVYAISNHFSSGPDGRVGQRTEQAAYNAAIIETVLEFDPGAYVTTGGDFNVYPRPDDPFTPGHPLYPSDQLGSLYEIGLTNLWDVLVAEAPSSAYSYVYQGQTQTLDQMFVTDSLLDELAGVYVAHINADFAADYFGDEARGTSDHDPTFAAYTLLPTIDRLEALVYYYYENGDITGTQTLKLLIDRLERARGFYERGQMDAYRDQLVAFTTQIQDLSTFISPAASDALIKETNFLLALP